MRKTLYIKFLIAYIIFGCFGFLFVATFVQALTEEQVTKIKAQQLYRSANEISINYALDLYNNDISLVSLQEHLRSMGRLWIHQYGLSIHQD